MDPERLAAILGGISYKPGYSLRSSRSRGRWFIQVHAEVEDADEPGTVRRFRGDKVWLSDHMVEGEVVQAAFAAFRSYEEHECREWFAYKGARTFGPHIDPLALAEVCHRTVGRANDWPPPSGPTLCQTCRQPGDTCPYEAEGGPVQPGGPFRRANDGGGAS